MRTLFMHSIAHQLNALQRIAAFSAKLRGHELGDWSAGEGFARARCIRCGSELQVYCSPVQPDMEGEALADRCGHGAVQRAA
jgi:hypothetical protein